MLPSPFHFNTPAISQNLKIFIWRKKHASCSVVKKRFSTCFACCIFCLHGTTRNGEGHPICTFLWHPLDLRNKLSLPIVQIPKQHIPWPKQVTKATKRGDDAVSLMDLKAMKPTGFSSFAHSGYTATIPKVSNTQMARGFRVANTSANPFLAPWAWLPSHDSCKSFSIFLALVQNHTRNWTPNFWDLWGLHGRFLSLLMYLNLLDSAWLAARHLTDDLHLNLDHPIHALLQMELNPKPQGWLTRWTSKCQILQIHSRPYNSLGFFRLQHLAKAQVGNTVSCGVSQQLSAEIHSTWPKLMKLMIQTCILEKEAKNCHSNHASFRGIGHIHVPKNSLSVPAKQHHQ